MSFSEKVSQLVQSYQTCEFVLMNRGIMREIGVNPTLVLSELLSRFNYHASKNQLDKDNSFFCTTEKLQELTTLSYKSQNTAISKLEDRGLIKVKHKQGNIRYFVIFIEKVKELISKFSKVVEKKTSSNKEENQNSTKGNSRNDQKENLEKPKGKVFIYKKNAIKPRYKKIIYIKSNNSSSSLKQIKSENNAPVEKKKMMNEYELALSDFLQVKGFSKLLIKQTVNQFEKKGITAFKMEQLESAYSKMIYHHNHVENVKYPPVFFANGVELACVELKESKKAEVATEEYPPVPFYDWLSDPYDSFSEAK